MFYFSKHRRLALNRVQGFSLLEMLIYIAILIIMLTVIMNIIISIMSTGRIIKSLRNIENSALISLERITREVRQAESVNTSSSILNSALGKLVLDGSDADGNPRTAEFYLSSGVLMFSENGIEIGALSPTGAKITGLLFEHFSGLNSEGIRTTITTESGTSTHYRSEKFYSTAVLR